MIRVALAQIDCTVGDLGANADKIKDYIAQALGLKADIVVFPELALTGYPPEDLLIKPKFIYDNLEKLKEVVSAVKNIIAVIGFVDKQGKDIYNAAAVIYNQKLYGVYRKAHLPNYGVFDEKRYFGQGTEPAVFSASNSFIFGVNICEDIWHLEGPLKFQAAQGAKFIVNLNSSPYHAGKIKERQEIIAKQAKFNKVTIVYCNLVGGQDELVFDGQSMVIDQAGKLVGRAAAFKEELLAVDLKPATVVSRPKKEIIDIPVKLPQGTRPFQEPRIADCLDDVEEVYQALGLGLKDYARKNGFKRAIIGLSGGIDSALVAVLAVDTLGKDNVTTVFMPSRYSSQESEADARALAQNLGIKLLNIPIEEIYKIYLGVLEPVFAGVEKNITEENLQARIRGNLLMALSNKFGWLVLATGNKSEMSTGYATLYGDMAGGFALIKDVPKTLVYKLANYRNSLGNIIPERIITKEPTAELKPDQKDSDTLPIYETLDPILKAYVEEDKDLNEIIAQGFDPEIVRRTAEMVDKSEYKRRQSPPGVKITPKAFGRDRRMPITNKYRG